MGGFLYEYTVLNVGFAVMSIVHVDMGSLVDEALEVIFSGLCCFASAMLHCIEHTYLKTSKRMWGAYGYNTYNGR